MLSKSASARRENRNLPRLARHGKLEGLADAPNNIALGDTAGVAFINRRPKRRESCFVLPLLAFQSPQPGAHHLAGVFVTSTLNLGGYEAVEFVGQIDVAGRHGVGPFYEWGFGITIAQLATIANPKLLPKRRSSDQRSCSAGTPVRVTESRRSRPIRGLDRSGRKVFVAALFDGHFSKSARKWRTRQNRSEEHTSELQ